MPELPDVQVLKEYLDATSLHQEIEAVEVYSDRIVKESSTQRLVDELKGHILESTRRHGKYLFVELDNGRWLVLHFGMTGRQVAIDRMAKPQEFPDSYLTPHRGQNGTCPHCGEPLRRVKVSGRSAYYCPNRQGEGPQG